MDGFSVNTFSDLMDNICASPSCENLCNATTDHLTAAIAIQATNEQVLTMAPYIDFMTAFNCKVWMMSVFERQEHRLLSYHSGIHDAVLQRCAPKIKSMTLAPLTLTHDLLPLASQMASLRRLHWEFCFDVSHMDILSRFMTELNQLKGRPGLEEFVLPRMSNLYQMDWLQEKERLILALGDVVSLDARPWLDFVRMCHRIPSQTLSRLTQLQLGTKFYQGHGGRFLQQCRALQKLNFPISDGNVFAWAKEERKHMATSNLVQLRTLEIWTAPFMVGTLLKSIFHGFSHSLENLHCACNDVTYSTDIFNPDGPPIDITTIPDESFVIDSTVRMPRLKKLHINHASSAWIRRCPSLETLVLDIVTPATLKPNMADIAKGPCGERLRTCQLIFFKQEVNKEWFPKVLETYCGHVVKLTVRTHDLYLYSWDGVDLGLLLTATEALSSLRTLTIHLGHEWKRIPLVKWYDMVKGRYCYQTNKVIWPPSVKLKKLRIVDSEAGHDIRGWYRQRAEESTDSIVVEAET
ncbi:MAG: hypothetical protein J3Q66DRAFT_414728 [Benniella sp.]|nr:MAG: hypothetical protein J3Q66DRAFT_414728 [Benniella sp.]